jgi:hypothetical protein
MKYRGSIKTRVKMLLYVYRDPKVPCDHICFAIGFHPIEEIHKFSEHWRILEQAGLAFHRIGEYSATKNGIEICDYIEN